MYAFKHVFGRFCRHCYFIPEWMVYRLPNYRPTVQSKEQRLRGKESDEQLHFHGDVLLSDTIMALETSYQFFTQLFTNELLNRLIDETNLYAVQNKSERSDVFTSTNTKQFIGIIFYTSLVRMPNIKCYWSEKLLFGPIRADMSLDKLEKIRQYIHFNDNRNLLPFSEAGHDRLY